MADILAASSPLGTSFDAIPVRMGDASRAGIVEHIPEVMLDVRLDPADAAATQAFEQATGLAFTVAPNQVVVGAGRTLLWLGPDARLLVAGREDAELAAQIERALARHRASVVDVSDLRAVMRITGAHAADVLRKGCAIDLHPRAFGPGASAVTAFARVRALLYQVDGAPTYELYVERSVARYLRDWLADAMCEFAAPGN